MGWDQGTIAIVRRRGDEGTNVPQAGEAVSMIAKTVLGSEFSLRPGETRNLLGADSYFVSGTAAMVAAVEEDKKVSIIAGNQEAVTGFVTEGTPEERISAALGMRSAQLADLRVRIAEEQGRVDGLLDSIDPGAYDEARVRLIATGLADADVRYDARTPAEKKAWLRKMSRAGDDEEDLEKLRIFRAGSALSAPGVPAFCPGAGCRLPRANRPPPALAGNPR
jgi:hypothetical protein